MSTTTIGLGELLEQAERELYRRREAIASGSSWEYTMLGHVADIVDHSRRVTLDSAGAHYQADKSGPIVSAALALQLVAMGQLAELHRGEGDDGWGDLDEVAELLADVAMAVRSSMWTMARGDDHHRSGARALVERTRRLHRWAEQVLSEASPDPVE